MASDSVQKMTLKNTILICFLLVLVINQIQSEYSCAKVNTNILSPCNCTGGNEYGLSINCKNATQWSIVRKSLNTLTIKKIDSLEIEDLNEDKLTEDHFKSYEIRSLKFINCKFKEFKKDALFSLNGTIKDLSLYCGLDRIPSELFTSLYNLTRFDLSNNNLTKLVTKSFDGLKNLTELILENNQIEKIESDAFFSLNNLEKLSLSKNKLSKFEKNALRNLKKLIYFDVSYNRFKEIDKKDIQDFSNLLHLNYSDNQIDKLPRSIFVRNSQLRTLSKSIESN